MDIRKLQRLIVDALEDVKAQDIKVYNTTHLTELFDRVVIASGTSNRQTKALASSVRDAVKAAGGDIIAVEGTETGEWVLVDCGDAVVHILQPQLRLYYNLEEIWGDKPVRIKLGGTAKGLPKASEAMDDDGGDEDNARRPLSSRRATARPALARLPEGMAEFSEPMGHENDAPAKKAPRKTAPRTGAASKRSGPAAGTPVRKTTRTSAGSAGSATKAPARKTTTRSTGATAPARKRTTRSA
jgi:ribosome-associated protein